MLGVLDLEVTHSIVGIFFAAVPGVIAMGFFFSLVGSVVGGFISFFKRFVILLSSKCEN